MLWLGALFAGAAEVPPVAAPEADPAPFTRVANPDEDTFKLQIALRKFVPAEGLGPAVWLSAVSHIGDSNYYAKLQKHLDERQLVLFEGVGAASQEAEEPQDDKVTVEAGGETKPEGDRKELGSVQTTLADSLGLEFQLDAIDYHRKHFRNADMSIYQLQWLMMGGSETNLPPRDWVPKPGAALPVPKVEGSDEEPQGNQQFENLLSVMDGSSMLGMMVDSALKMIGSSPRLQALTRLMFIQTLGKLEGDMAQMQGLPPDMLQLIQVLIRSRNRVVVADVKEALKELKPDESLSVFYGAGHMPDLEKRLCSELNYKQAEEVWLDAFSVNTKDAGVSAFEKKMVQYMMDIQMQIFSRQMAPPKKEAPTEGKESEPAKDAAPTKE